MTHLARCGQHLREARIFESQEQQEKQNQANQQRMPMNSLCFCGLSSHASSNGDRTHAHDASMKNLRII
jgi:hypothetical protein